MERNEIQIFRRILKQQHRKNDLNRIKNYKREKEVDGNVCFFAKVN